MESFKITAKEFLLLCTATDTDEVYGVDDAYENLTEDNVEKEVRNAQKSLEEKNYIQSDFDGNSEIRDDLMELISCCSGIPVVNSCSLSQEAKKRHPVNVPASRN